MSIETQLYELARQRINRRSRRILLLGLNIFGFLLFVGAFAGLGFVQRSVGVFGAMAWMGLIVLHVLLLGMTQYRDEALEGEIAKLREMVYDEKPKRRDARLELDEDGELVDAPDMVENERAYKERGDSL